MRRLIAVLCAAVSIAACGGGDEPKTPKRELDPPEAKPVVPPAASSEAPPVVSEAAKKRRPYEIVNLCPRVATLLFDKGGSEDPKAATVGSRTIAGNGRIDDPPRDNDGNQVIWLMVRDVPLVRVRVSRGTKRIEVGTSCDTLEMH